MARPVSITKERILAAALDIVRGGGPQALTARSLSAAFGCGAGALFNSFGSIRGIRDAVKAEARRLYQLRVRAGFSLHPPFKGFGMAFLWFAMDEPQVSEILGKNARAFLMVIRAGVDDREKFIPRAGAGPGGDVDSYTLLHTLTGQNHLLQELHACPRFIQDDEWANWNGCSGIPSMLFLIPFGRPTPASPRATSASTCSLTSSSPCRSRPSFSVSPLHPLPKPGSG